MGSFTLLSDVGYVSLSYLSGLSANCCNTKVFIKEQVHKATRSLVTYGCSAQVLFGFL
jgi:hypothetical protein